MMSWTHTFDEETAVEFGVPEAIMIEHLRYWIRKNRSEGNQEVHYHEDRWWTFNSAKSWSELLPFWNAKQITYIMDKLISQKVIRTGKFNKLPFDQTLWYSFEDESRWLDNPKKESQSSQKSEMRTPKSRKPIPSSYSSKTNKEDKEPSVPRLITDYFWKKFQEKTGVTPVWKEQYHGMAKRLSSTGSVEKVSKAIDAYFDRKWWFVNGGGYDFGQFFQHFNEIASATMKAEWIPRVCPHCGSKQMSTSAECDTCHKPMEASHAAK